MSSSAETVPTTGLMDGPTILQALPSLVVIAAAAVAETYGARKGLPVTGLVLCHTAIVGAIATHLWRRHRAGGDFRLSAIALLTIGTAGPFGAVGALIAFLLHAVFQLRSTPFERHFAALFPELREDDACALARRIAEGRLTIKTTSAVTSFAEIMEVGSFEEKQRAISHISGRFRPEFASTLHRALGDPEPAIRVEAAIVPSRIEKQFDEQLMALERQAAAGERQSVIALAEHLDHMAHSGLLDSERSLATRERALCVYRSAAADRLDGIEIPLGRLLIRLGRDQEACAWFDRLPASTWQAPRAMLWRLESLYRVGRLAELRSLCRTYQAELSGTTDVPRHLRDAVAMWAAEA